MGKFDCERPARLLKDLRGRPALSGQILIIPRLYTKSVPSPTDYYTHSKLHT